MSDTVVYSIVIPVMPFQLKQMGYHNISGRLGWLLFAYVYLSFLHLGFH